MKSCSKRYSRSKWEAKGGNSERSMIGSERHAQLLIMIMGMATTTERPRLLEVNSTFDATEQWREVQ